MSQPARMPYLLPASPAPLFGRERERARILELLQQPNCRIVSLLGPGGVGKTRLALECAHILMADPQPRFVDGVVLVSLAELTPGELLAERLATTIAGALGLAFAGAEAPTEQLYRYLSGRSLLLLLDNVEHLAGAAPLLGTLLQAAPAVVLLTTSREPLRLRGEWCVALEGLELPPEPHPATGAAPSLSIDELAQSSAIQLFVQRARMVDPTFTLTPAHAPAVLRICRIVDGLPLGIELACAWLRALTCDELAAELARDLDVLASDAPDLEPRQRSLRRLFDSSWRLLTGDEQRALRRLALFHGSFTREAAAEVAEISLPMLATLVDKSLVHRGSAADGGAPTRYMLLEQVRQYAGEQLERAGEASELARRHARYYANLLAARVPELRGAGQQAALATIVTEIAQIRVAWQSACANADAGCLRLAADGLFHFYDMRSWFQEGAAAFAAAAGALAADQSTPARDLAGAYMQARQGWFVFYLGQQRQAQALLGSSLATMRRLGVRAEQIFPLNYLAAVCNYLGEYATAEALCRESIDIAQALGSIYEQAIAYNILGQAAYDQGRYAMAQSWSQQSLAIEQQLGNRWSMAFSLTNLGKVAYITGSYVEARWYFDESLSIRQRMGDTRGVAICHNLLGETAVALGEAGEAQQHYDQSLALFRSVGERWGIAAALINLVHLLLACGDDLAALRVMHEALTIALEMEALPQLVTLLATAAPLIRRSGDRAWADALDQLLAAAPTALRQYQPHIRRILTWIARGPQATASPADRPVTPAGGGRTGVAHTTPGARPSRPGAYPAGLTAREVEVLRLVAQGLTDAQVANRLVVSRRTVSTHLSAIYGKLQVNSRSAATRFAIEKGLG